jgi:hypothetical protein
MPKSAIINLSREGILEKTSFKKLSLFFENIYVNRTDLWMSQRDIEGSKKLSKEDKNALLSEIEWLIEKGIIKTYYVAKDEFVAAQFDSLLTADIKETNKSIQERIIPIPLDEQEKRKPGEFGLAGVFSVTNELMFKMEDIKIRVDATVLGLKEKETHFIPIVNSFDSYQRLNSNDFAFHFILSKIPTPDINTSWEQLLDFRSDEDVKGKYYALVNWANEITTQDMPLSNLTDKYNYLYNEYLRQYSLHKLNSNLSIIELLLTGGMEFIGSILNQNLFTAFKGLINIRKQQVALLQTEKGIQGRELAYIFSVNETFK